MKVLSTPHIVHITLTTEFPANIVRTLKSDAAAELMKWIPLVETLTRKKLKRLRIDNGGEFLAGKL